MRAPRSSLHLRSLTRKLSPDRLGGPPGAQAHPPASCVLGFALWHCLDLPGYGDAADCAYSNRVRRASGSGVVSEHRHKTQDAGLIQHGRRNKQDTPAARSCARAHVSDVFLRPHQRPARSSRRCAPPRAVTANSHYSTSALAFTSISRSERVLEFKTQEIPAPGRKRGAEKPHFAACVDVVVPRRSDASPGDCVVSPDSRTGRVDK